MLFVDESSCDFIELAKFVIEDEEYEMKNDKDIDTNDYLKLRLLFDNFKRDPLIKENKEMFEQSWRQL